MTISDSDAATAADRIHALMDGREWSSDTTSSVAEILTGAGYVIREPGDAETQGDPLPPELHHIDCDYRNSVAAKEAAETLGVDVEENREVYDCNLGCTRQVRSDGLVGELRHCCDVMRQARDAIADPAQRGSYVPLRAADVRLMLAMSRIEDLIGGAS